MLDGSSSLEFFLAQDDALAQIVNQLTTQNIHILNLQKREPTLEDVFVDLVGRSMEEVESESGDSD
jgi:ABC-2 type transport system ATP-binding protein